MKIEHTALNVAEPAMVGDWYVRHLGFTIRRQADVPLPVRFLADESGQVMLEVYRNPAAPVPNYREMDPLVLHIAFVCDDVEATHRRLIEAGAEAVGEITTAPNGDVLAMLRDPWALAIQLCDRVEPMV